MSTTELFLVDLPSRYGCMPYTVYLEVDSYIISHICRGFLKHVQVGAAFSSPPVSYVAAHNTSPPKGQVVTTDQSSLLIKCLQKKNVRSSEVSRPKRQAPEQQPVSNKRRADGSSSSSVIVYARGGLETMTVKELQEILNKRGQSTRGRRLELIERIIESQ